MRTNYDPARWRYIAGLTSGTFTVSAPNTPGNYEVRYLRNNTFTDVARSNTIIVGSSSAFDFSLSNGGNQSVVQGGSVNNTINATLVTGSTQSVTFSVSGLPTGVTASFAPGNCDPNCATTMTINTTVATPAATSLITVTGVGAGITRTTTFNLTVTLPFNFSLSNSGNSSVAQGASIGNTITATLVSAQQ